MEIFKDSHGKVYAVIPREVPKHKAVTEANERFRESIAELSVTIGEVTGEDLKIHARKGNVWVITRKGTKE